jgi:surface protein
LTCLENTNTDKEDIVKIITKITNEKQKVIFEEEKNTTYASSSYGIVSNFIPKSSNNNITLETKVYNKEGVLLDELKAEYICEDLLDNCSKKFSDYFNLKNILIFVGLLILLLLVIIFKKRFCKKSLPTLIVLIISMLFAFPSVQADASTADFITTWDTTKTMTGSSNASSITIPVDVASIYSYRVDWNNDGDLIDATESTLYTSPATHDFGAPGVYTIRIVGTFSRIYFFSSPDKQKILRVNQWGTGAWTSMSLAFTGCINFNGTASDVPNLSNVTDMSFMFSGASSFNQPIGDWDTSKVTNMYGMFAYATSFDQPLGTWSVASLNTALNMFSGVTLSTANYDNLLIGWDAQVLKRSVFFSGGNSKYCTSEANRTHIISSDNWGIVDGGLNCVPFCPANIAPGEPVVIMNPTTATVGVPVEFTFSSTDPEGDPLTYQVDWGLGAGFQTVTSPQSMTWSIVGTKTVKIVASDGCSSSVVKTITVIVEDTSTQTCSCNGTRTFTCTTNGMTTTTESNSSQCAFKSYCTVATTTSETVFTFGPNHRIADVTYKNLAQGILETKSAEPYIFIHTIPKTSGVQSLTLSLTDSYDNSTTSPRTCSVDNTIIPVPIIPVINIIKSPRISLNKNSKCRLDWDIQNMPAGTTCALSGNSTGASLSLPLSFNSNSGTGTKYWISGPLQQNTKYTISCSGTNLSSSITKSAVCRINPTIGEI